jgi:hypothetical protein
MIEDSARIYIRFDITEYSRSSITERAGEDYYMKSYVFSVIIYVYYIRVNKEEIFILYLL